MIMDSGLHNTHIESHATARAWAVKGLPASVKASIAGIPLLGNPDTLASMLIAMTRQKGILGYTAAIDASTHTIDLVLNKDKLSGSLRRYAGADSQTVKGLTHHSVLLSAAAASYGGTPAIKVGQPLNGKTPVYIGVKQAGFKYGGGAMLSSFGPRYAGSDVASEFGYARGDGYVGSIAFTQGLPTWTPTQSFGGYYYGVSGTLTHPTPYGIFGIKDQSGIYREGGSASSLGITGFQELFGLTYAYPFTKHWEATGALLYGDQTESLAVANLHSTQDFVASEAGLRGSIGTGYRNGVINLRSDAYMGMGGNTSGYLLGQPSSNSWQMARVRGSVFQPLPFGLAVQAKAGGQYGTNNTPQQEYFILGGAWHGDSYYTGQAVAPDGMYGGMRLYAPDMHFAAYNHHFNARPYIGVNGADGKPIVGPELVAASADLGAKFSITQHITGNVGYAQSIDNQGPHTPAGRLFFQVVGNY
jgi:hypothetical protein